MLQIIEVNEKERTSDILTTGGNKLEEPSSVTDSLSLNIFQILMWEMV